MKIQKLSKITECSLFRNGIRDFNTTPKRNAIPLGQKINYNTSVLFWISDLSLWGEMNDSKTERIARSMFSPAEAAEYHENFLSPTENTTFLKRKQNSVTAIKIIGLLHYGISELFNHGKLRFTHARSIVTTRTGNSAKLAMKSRQ